MLILISQSLNHHLQISSVVKPTVQKPKDFIYYHKLQ